MTPRRGLDHVRRKYASIGPLYDILDAPCEKLYRPWRRQLLRDVSGRVLEAGVGTGHNLPFYRPGAKVLGIDLSPPMLARARKKAAEASVQVELRLEDASRLSSVPDDSFDWVISTFMFSVMPDPLQGPTLRQFARVLRPGGRFRLIEVVYSRLPRWKRLQQLIQPPIEWIYGTRFDRPTLRLIKQTEGLELVELTFLRWDIYLQIEGRRLD